ncbi:hypothetical protein PFISCL1PPCAC_15519, partial [Pristionchus fissidentatus]
DPTLALILIGILIFVIGFCGCLGSLRENTILLTIFMATLGTIILVEIILICVAYFYSDKFMEILSDLMKNMISHYSDMENLQDIMDQIQIMMKCCGIDGPDDWDANMYFMKDQNSAHPPPDAGGVPFSCCHTPYNNLTGLVNTGCGRHARSAIISSDVFTNGCRAAFEEWKSTNMLAFTISLGVVFIVQVVAFIMAQNLKGDINAQKAKWFES